MDAYTTVITKRDVRTFSELEVSEDNQLKVLDAGRLAGTGKNLQRCRIVPP